MTTPNPLDRIRVEGIRINCVIGLNEWERLVRQEVVIDVTVHADTRKAGASDNVADTVNYRTVIKKVVEHVTASRYRLIEALAENVARLCLSEPGARRVDVRVRKPGALRDADSVGVEISRSSIDDARRASA
jgi:FolB domain-containing protein